MLKNVTGTFYQESMSITVIADDIQSFVNAVKELRQQKNSTMPKDCIIQDLH